MMTAKGMTLILFAAMLLGVQGITWWLVVLPVVAEFLLDCFVVLIKGLVN